MSKINVNQELCIKCKKCVEICPFSIYVLIDSNKVPGIINDELCVSCGHCVAICPSNAISHVDFSKGSIKPVNEKMLPSEKQLFEIIKSRRSIRVFIDKPVEKSKITQIIEGACFAPSTNNIQSTQFVVVQDKEILNKITKLTFDYLQNLVSKLKNPFIRSILFIFAKNKIKSAYIRIPDYNKIINSFKSGKDLITHNAPVLIFFYADKNIGFSDVNANLALQNASIVCQSIGLGCFYAGYVIAACNYNKDIQRLLNLKNNFNILGCLAVGYPKYEFKNWIAKKPSKILWV